MSVPSSPPAQSNTYTTLDPLTLDGFAASNNEVRGVTVTVNGTPIYTVTYASGVTNTTWSTHWTPRSGTYTVEAMMTNGLGQQISDPVDTVLTFIAPNLTVSKTVTPNQRSARRQTRHLHRGGWQQWQRRRQQRDVSDTLPAEVSGSNLNDTVDLSVGQKITYTIPAIVLDGDNRAYRQHRLHQPHLAARASQRQLHPLR